MWNKGNTHLSLKGVTSVQATVEMSLTVLWNMGICSPQISAVPLLVTYHNDNCSTIFIAAWLIIPRN